MVVGQIGNAKILRVRSSDRSWGTPSNFGVNLGQFNLNARYCSWHQVALPNGFYNLNTASNTLVVTVYDSSTTPWMVSIGGSLPSTSPGYLPPGWYTASSLIPAVQTALNASLKAMNQAAPSNFFTVAWNGATGFVNISSNTAGWAFTINTSYASLDWILGFRSPPTQPASQVTLVTSATGAVILDLRSYPNVYIRTSMVSGNYLNALGADSVICCVQNTATFGQTIFQRSPAADLDVFPICGQLSQVSFQLVDEYGNELKMDSNQEWEMNIGMYD